MLTLLRNGTVYAPAPLGKKDVLLAGTMIEAVADPGKITVNGAECETIDASDKLILPGLVDGHVHILGGGGEGGPATRAPEIQIEDIIRCGVTTLIGCLGTDSVTRHMESLLAKARALEKEGITACIFSGSYEIPVKTLTGSVRSDLVLIEQVIGAGEIAISDHRSSQPSFDEVARLAAECRVGGMLGGKAGVVHFHLGDGERGLEFLFRLIRETEIPATQVIPTHVNRNRRLLQEAMEFALAGGTIDLTTGPDPKPEDPEAGLEECVYLFLEKRIPLTRITVSSDSNGSFPVFNRDGILLGLTIASQKDFLRKFQDIVRKNMLDVEAAVRLFSTNAAGFYKLERKGEVKEGSDADLILLNKDFELADVFALGRKMMAGGKVLARRTFSLPS